MTTVVPKEIMISYFFFFFIQVDNNAVRKCTNVTDMTGKDFMDPTKDKTIRAHPVEEEK